MLRVFKNLYDYRELLIVLTWKNIIVRYKQSHLGMLWAIFKPLILLAVFLLIRSFVGIDSGDVPYALLTYCALVPWMFFQEAAADGVGSIVSNANLIRKIYFPREIFPVSAVATKLVELAIGLCILAGLMVWYRVAPSWSMWWAPLIILFTIMATLTVALVGAALNAYSRDVAFFVPLALSLLMYASPVMYPLALVKKKLLIEQAAGDWSNLLYTLYAANPMTGIVDSFQRVMLQGLAPDWGTLAPGLVMIAVLLPLSYFFFKQAEAYFADVI